MEDKMIFLWQDGPPDSLGKRPEDRPGLQVYLPEKTVPGPLPGMLICPGGGYEFLADHEGSGFARWLNGLGIAGLVLQYRLGSAGYRHPAMLNDAKRAMRLIRAQCADWHVDPRRLGVIGSSAGGHLASTLLTHFDEGDLASADPVERFSSRPDLGILCYPVISMGEFTHNGSRQNLLGDAPTAGLIESLSSERQVRRDTPPCFIWHTAEDTCVPPVNSLMFASSLCSAGVPCELHLYEKGGHGMGLGQSLDGKPGYHPWTDACRLWLKHHFNLA